MYQIVASEVLYKPPCMAYIQKSVLHPNYGPWSTSPNARGCAWFDSLWPNGRALSWATDYWDWTRRWSKTLVWTGRKSVSSPHRRTPVSGRKFWVMRRFQLVHLVTLWWLESSWINAAVGFWFGAPSGLDTLPTRLRRPPGLPLMPGTSSCSRMAGTISGCTFSSRLCINAKNQISVALHCQGHKPFEFQKLLANLDPFSRYSVSNNSMRLGKTLTQFERVHFLWGLPQP